MSTIVTIHSFRRGVGKSSLSVNLAVLLALQGRRVALIDTDFQSPSIHLFFGLSDGKATHTLNDYLWDKCDILSTVQDLTSRLAPDISGKLFVIPASDKIADIMQIIRTPPNIDRYMGGLEKLEKELDLDILLVDTSAGLNENTLQVIAVSNVVVLVLHPDKYDFQGTAVTVDMARRLQIPTIHLILNDVPDNLDVENIHLQLEQTYHCGGGIVLNHTEELMALSSSQPFVLRYPEHPLTVQIKELAEQL
ncbi:MAG: MinD/ParA family protein [Anaerolineales bacterium]|nr:MinD/ParA family protein [Anaerolineales bacterium]